MNNEVERYVGELRDLRRVNHTILENKEFLKKLVMWLAAEIRMKPMSDFEKTNKQKLKDTLEQLLAACVEESKVRVSGVPYEVELQKDLF